MKYNMHNHRQNVFEAEVFLRRNHLLEGGPLTNPDGLFSVETTAAVELFQRQNEIPITGIIDFETWTKLAETWRALCLENPRLIDLGQTKF